MPGLHAETLVDPTLASVWLPEGTVDFTWDRGFIRGTFSLSGRPHGVADTTVVVAVEGRFEIPFEG